MPPKPRPKPQLVPTLSRAEPTPPIHPFDAAHHTDTGGLIPGPDLRTGTPSHRFSDRFVTAYYGVAPSILRTLLDLWLDRTHPPLPIEHYTFVDIGAGKGRAMLVGATNPFREVVGIELNPAMAAIAIENLRRVQAQPNYLLAPIRLVEADALTTPLPAGPLLLFLFHPFEAPALRRLLRRIAQAAAVPSDPRPGLVDLLYVNAEHATTIARDPHFRELWQGRIPMSTEDHIADLKEIATQLDYGSTGDELCAIFRYTGPQP